MQTNMTDDQKRVAIAMDVVGKLKSNKVKAKMNSWLNFLGTLFTKQDIDGGVQLQDKFRDARGCEACAIGTMFVSAVDLYNDLKCSEVYRHTLSEYSYASYLELVDFKHYLLKFFSEDQIHLIECAFEFGHGGFHAETDEQFCAASMFWNIEDPKTRMIAIMSNIIDNNGAFAVPVNQTLLNLWNDVVCDFDIDAVDEDDRPLYDYEY